jgi:hypothetical protein
MLLTFEADYFEVIRQVYLTRYKFRGKKPKNDKKDILGGYANKVFTARQKGKNLAYVLKDFRQVA